MIEKSKINIAVRAITGAAILTVMIGLIVWSPQAMDAAGSAAEMCLKSVLPSLFPFMVVSNLLIGMGYVDAAGRLLAPVTKKSFNLSGSCAGPILLGISGGYPLGARAAATLYEQGGCSKTEFERMLGFCNNSGPAFILGAVGAGVFGDIRAGLALYIAHVAAAFILGFFFRFYKKSEKSSRGTVALKKADFYTVFVSSTRSALIGIGNISGFVIVFAVLARLLTVCGAFGAAAGFISRVTGTDAGDVSRLLTGALEMTSGLYSLDASSASMNAKLAMAAAMLGWAGISVHFQTLSFVGGYGLNLKPYLLGKLGHAALSAVLAPVFWNLLCHGSAQAWAAAQEYMSSAPGPWPCVAALSAAAAAVFALRLSDRKNI